MDFNSTVKGSLLEGFYPEGWDFKKIDEIFNPGINKNISVGSVVEINEEPVIEEPAFSEPVYEIADIEIPNIEFAEDVTFEAPVQVETVDDVTFTDPAAYEVSTEIADVTFIDDENLVPPAKEDVLKQAAKTVGAKRTVKEKVAEEVAEDAE